MGTNIDYFLNHRFRVLKCMEERQIEVSGLTYVPLSQRQIAEITGIAFGTVNSIIKDLKICGYVEYNGTATRGKYSLTTKAKMAITHIVRDESNLVSTCF